MSPVERQGSLRLLVSKAELTKLFLEGPGAKARRIMSDTGWPALRYETLEWLIDPSRSMSNTARRRHDRPYEAAVTPAIAGLVPTVGAEVLAAADEAAMAIVRFPRPSPRRQRPRGARRRGVSRNVTVPISGRVACKGPSVLGNAELVAFGISKRRPLDSPFVPVMDVGCSEFEESRDLAGKVGGAEIEADTILRRRSRR